MGHLIGDSQIEAHYMLETLKRKHYIHKHSYRNSLINIILYSLERERERTKSKNQNNSKSQSAGNEINKVGTSETIRALSDKNEWLAGVIDGDGNFDIRTINGQKILKSIRITMSIEGARVLYKVKEILKGGSIKPKGKYLIYRISHKAGMLTCLEKINGNIRLKTKGMKEACISMNIGYIQAESRVPENSGYWAGLLDTVGTVVLNKPGNRIDVHFELRKNENSEELDLSGVISGATITKIDLIKRNQTREKIYYSIRISYAAITNMKKIYEYVKKNRLYNDKKFKRVMKIKRFLEIREYKRYPEGTIERQVYENFIKEWEK